MNYLITPTLLNSFDWLQGAQGNWRIKAEEDFSNLLHRKYSSVMPKPVELGIRFEDAVYRTANKAESLWTGSHEFQAVCREVHGAQFQRVAKKIIVVDGEEYCLYGKMDALFPAKKIVDIKTTQNYRGRDKYLSGWQHHVYTFCTDIRDFLYLVAVLDESERVDELHRLPYHVEDFRFIQVRIEEQIRTIRNFVSEDKTLDEAYRKIFSRNS